MSKTSDAVSAYGVLIKHAVSDEVEKVVEQITNLGFAVVGSGYTDEAIALISTTFDRAHSEYVAHYGEDRLRRIDEYNGIRLPLTFDKSFLNLLMNEVVLSVVAKLIQGKFILNQQNGIVNPPGQKYNQGAWHRDLPYQHFVSSRPIAINALYCVDEFTKENGATYVLPASHKQEAFPSDSFILNNQVQVVAPAGSFVVIDCMAFHRGGVNATVNRRRAVNHVYTIPHIRQQIDIPAVVDSENLDAPARDLLGCRDRLPRSVDDFLNSRPVQL
jgi:ectoine hydroxylase-related dioxygenase (phytanoyl-CoA dioxygenase family)